MLDNSNGHLTNDSINNLKNADAFCFDVDSTLINHESLDDFAAMFDIDLTNMLELLYIMKSC